MKSSAINGQRSLSFVRGRFQAWADFHANNPAVYELFVRFAHEARLAGRDKLGARVIGERIRWYCSVEVSQAGDFRLNDHFWPYYSRLLMLQQPEMFQAFFDRRDARFDATDQQILAAHGDTDTLTRRGAAVARVAHNHEVAGAIPAAGICENV